MMWELELASLAGKLPAGMPDSRASEKYSVEWAELRQAIEQGDRTEIAAEAADCLYYVVKAKYSGISVDVSAELEKISSAAHILPQAIVEAALMKYHMRAAPGNPKNTEAENASIERVLTACWAGRNSCFCCGDYDDCVSRDAGSWPIRLNGDCPYCGAPALACQCPP